MDEQQETINMLRTQVLQQVSASYQTLINDISVASTLALHPNWREVFDEHYAEYLRDTTHDANEFKEVISSRLPSGDVLEARSAITDSLNMAHNASAGQKQRIVSMVEQLLG